MSWRAEHHKNGHASTSPESSKRSHDVDSLDCWCRPQFFVPCDECDEHATSCWKCSPITLSDGSIVHGLIEVDYATASIGDVTVIIAHRIA